jgi:uncharacterized RDD family membrane protein YckC
VVQNDCRLISHQRTSNIISYSEELTNPVASGKNVSPLGAHLSFTNSKKEVKEMDADKCVQCGTQVAPGAKFCESCGAPLVATEAPPEQQRQAQAPAKGTQLRYQSVGIRFAATVIDVLVLSIISWILVSIAIGSAFSSIAPISPATTGDLNATIAQVQASLSQLSGALSAGIATATVITVIVWFFYYTLLEGRYGQTLGKWFCKIKVIKEDGSAPIGYSAAAIRTVLRIIDGLIDYLIGAILIWTSEKKQRLGDRLAHTIVIQLCDAE